MLALDIVIRAARFGVALLRLAPPCLSASLNCLDLRARVVNHLWVIRHDCCVDARTHAQRAVGKTG